MPQLFVDMGREVYVGFLANSQLFIDEGREILVFILTNSVHLSLNEAARSRFRLRIDEITAVFSLHSVCLLQCGRNQLSLYKLSPISLDLQATVDVVRGMFNFPLHL